LAPAIIITVTRDGSRFLAQLTSQPTFEIVGESEKQFFYRVVDAIEARLAARPASESIQNR
jgi:hypothetical protein